MDSSRSKVLQMLSEGKVTVEEAERLLATIERSRSAGPSYEGAEGPGSRRAKCLCVVLEPNADSSSEPRSDRVNIRVPMALIRAGVKLTALVPDGVEEKINEALNQEGLEFDLRNLKSDDLERLVDALQVLEISVESRHERVHIYVE